jgi:hypothetical protein
MEDVDGVGCEAVGGYFVNGKICNVKNNVTRNIDVTRVNIKTLITLMK